MITRIQELAEAVSALVVSLKMPDDVKSAWLAQLPQMDVGQLKRAVDLLSEHAYEESKEEIAKIRKECSEILLRSASTD